MMTRMSCKRAEKLMPLYAAGDLPAGGESRAVAAHVAGCASCAALAEEYGASREWARAAGDVPEFGDEFYESLRAGVLDRVNRDTRPAAPTRVASFFPALFAGRRLAYAASLALAAFALALALYLGRDGARQTPRDDVADTRPPAGKLITPPTPAPAVPTPDAGERQPTPDASPEEKETRQPGRKRAGGGFKRTPTLRRPTPDAARAPMLTASANDDARRGVAQPAPRAETASASRIEIQTADPNIRIIWLAPAAGADDEPGAVDTDRVDPER